MQTVLAHGAAEALAIPDRPSIAVLPFVNLSGDPSQDYLVDGVVDDIISALSRNRWLFVIARNSSFTYKGRAVDEKQVGRELGVRYVLERSLRKATDRIRITGQLVDAITGTNLWSERFEGRLDDIFALQDEMTTSIVGAIAPHLQRAEIERARHKPTASLDAHDYFLQAMAQMHRGTREAIDQAQVLFSRAIELDSNFATALGMAAWCYFWRKVNGWLVDRPREIAEGRQLGAQSVRARRRTKRLRVGSPNAKHTDLANNSEEPAHVVDTLLRLAKRGFKGGDDHAHVCGVTV